MREDEMIYLVYASSAARLFTKDELADLLAVSRTNNARAGITGMLVYKGGNFLQVLEGEEEPVEALHRKILLDPRHKGIITLICGPLAERAFPEWSMEFRDLGAAEVQSDPAFSDFLNTPLTGEEFSANPTRAQKLLLSFKRAM
jgi:Sensors of blue-light using FAD